MKKAAEQKYVQRPVHIANHSLKLPGSVVLLRVGQQRLVDVLNGLGGNLG